MFRGLRGLRCAYGYFCFPCHLGSIAQRSGAGDCFLTCCISSLLQPILPLAMCYNATVYRQALYRVGQRAAFVPVVLALLLLLAVPSESGGERSTSGGGVHAARDRGTTATAGHRRAGAGGASRLPIDETTREDARRRRARESARASTEIVRRATHRDARLRRDARVAFPCELSNKT